MKIYHGSKNKFETFSYDKIRTNATSEGVGFYCTDNKEVAERYGSNGYVMTYEYKGRKRLNSKKVTLTEDELRKYLLALDEDDEFLSNYGDIGWDGIDKVLACALEDLLEYSKDDVELISGICNSFGGFERPLEILYDVLGYDSAIVDAKWGNQKIYLIFHNSALKLIECRECEGEK